MIIFKNAGILDVRSITTFGVSSKENESAIGYFGTGLKYAIAILLREGCSIDIQTGGVLHKFSTKNEKVRVNDFTFVTMNDVPLAFTTELGKNWELWQAFRELYCNCLDENGTVFSDFNSPSVDDNSTVITVSGEAFQDVYLRRHEFILNKPKMMELGGVDIHEGHSIITYFTKALLFIN